MNYFFDTSALVKFFHEEAGTELVTQLINEPENEVWISELTIVEFLSVMFASLTDAWRFAGLTVSSLPRGKNC